MVRKAARRAAEENNRSKTSALEKSFRECAESIDFELDGTAGKLTQLKEHFRAPWTLPEDNYFDPARKAVAAWLTQRRITLEDVVRRPQDHLQPMLHIAARAELSGLCSRPVGLLKYAFCDSSFVDTMRKCLPGAWEQLVVHGREDLNSEKACHFWEGFVVSPLRSHFRSRFDLEGGEDPFDVLQFGKDWSIACLLLAELVSTPPDEGTPKRRGRRAQYDPDADQRIAESWESGSYARTEDLASELRIGKDHVRHALDRHRKRKARG